MAKKCFYDVLGVPRDADAAALKKAYRKLAVKWHPDKHVNASDAQQKKAEAMFKDVASAYDVLNDPEKRRVYDQFGHAGLEGGVPSNSAGGGMGSMPHSFGFPGSDGGQTFVFRSTGNAPHFDGPGGVDPMQLFAEMFGSSGLGGMAGEQGMGPSRPTNGDHPFASMFGGMGIGSHMPAMSAMHSSRKRHRSPNEDPGIGLPTGTTVRVRGLLNSPQHNGQLGIVEQRTSAGRYVVRLQNSERISVQRANLLQQLQVTITNLTSRPDLNGAKALVVDYDAQRDRYVVQVGRNKEKVSLGRASVILPDDSSILVSGLTSSSGSALNGKQAKVLSWDKAAGRYTVAIGGCGRKSDQIVKLKPVNCAA